MKDKLQGANAGSLPVCRSTGPPVGEEYKRRLQVASFEMRGARYKYGF